MSYDLDQFIADCRAALKRDPGPGGRETVRVKLEELLRNPEFIEEYCGEKVPRGLKVLYEDPDLKFQILAHINDKARVSRRTITARPGRSTARPRSTPT